MGDVRGGGESGEARPELAEDLAEVSDFFRALGKQIELLRERAGMTQKELGSQVGYTEAMIGSVERGSARRSRSCWTRRTNSSTRAGC